MSRPLSALAAVAFAVLWGTSSAAAEVGAEKRAIIMLRVLAYDHALAARPGSAVRLAVVHGEGTASVECAGRMHAALDGPGTMVAGKPLEVETLPAANVNGPELARDGFAVLFVCGGSDRHVPGIVVAARAARVLTLTDQPSYLTRGLSIALSDEGTRIGISVNLVAARAEGARLAGHLLRLSKVVAR